MSIKEKIINQLKLHNFVPSKVPTLASRDYDSAAGVKTATIWLSKPNIQGHVWLTADFFSEGRNVLSTCTQDISITSDSATCADSVDKFVRDVESCVAGSYAVKLFRKSAASAAKPELKTGVSQCL